MAEPTNVIKFPKQPKPRPKPRPTLFVWPKRHHKSFLCAAVLCVLLGSALWNLSLQQAFKAQESARLVMGAEDRLMGGPKTFQRHVASDLPARGRETLVRRQLATKNETVLGRRPSSMDQLKFGLLAGHYTLEYTGASSSFVKSFKFVKKSGVFPVLVKDRKSFLKQYAHLWPVQFDNIVTLKRHLDGEVLHESYGLQYKGLQMAQAQMQLDRLEHLLHLKINQK